MSRCVPNWDLDEDDNNACPRLSLLGPDLPPVDSDVAELTWENGRLSLHGLGQSRLNSKPTTASGTLESLTNQAAPAANQAVPVTGCKPSYACGAYHFPWFDPSHAPTNVVAAASAPMMMDALVPCAAAVADDPRRQAMWLLAGSAAHGTGACGGCSNRVGSCSELGRGDGLLRPEEEQQQQGSRKRMRYDDGGGEWGDHQSVSGSATFSQRGTTQDTHERERELENKVSKGSPENTGSRNSSGGRVAAANTEEHDSVYSRLQREDELNRRNGKSSLSTKRSRAAAIHNQSERKRRDKINQRMKTLQKLVPNSSKTDKASVLDEVIDYLKQLQAQVQMMSRTSMIPLSPMMLQLALQQQQQQQLQLSMMTSPMGLGQGLAGMPGIVAGDMSTLGVTGLPNIPGIPSAPVVPPYPFMPMASWDGTLGARFAPIPMTPDPLSAFLSGQSAPNYDLQAMTMDAYSRLAAIYQHQQPSNPNPNPNH